MPWRTYETVVQLEQLVASIHPNLWLACRTLTEGAVPPADEIWQAEKATVERLRAGVWDPVRRRSSIRIQFSSVSTWTIKIQACQVANIRGEALQQGVDQRPLSDSGVRRVTP